MPKLMELGKHHKNHKQPLIYHNILAFYGEKSEDIDGMCDYHKEWDIPEIRKKLNCGIDIVNVEDLSKIRMPSDAIKANNSIMINAGSNPLLVKGIKNLEFELKKENKRKDCYKKDFPEGINALYCHGKDGKIDRNPPVDNWMLKKDADKKFRDTPIPEIIRIIEKEIPIDVIHVCNAGEYYDKVLENKLYCLATTGDSIDIVEDKVVERIISMVPEKLVIPKRIFKRAEYDSSFSDSNDELIELIKELNNT